jgi:hypothetical protein
MVSFVRCAGTHVISIIDIMLLLIVPFTVSHNHGGRQLARSQGLGHFLKIGE